MATWATTGSLQTDFVGLTAKSGLAWRWSTGSKLFYGIASIASDGEVLQYNATVGAGFAIVVPALIETPDTITITGLPTGLVFQSNFRRIFGYPVTAGTYVCNYIVTKGSDTKNASIKIIVTGTASKVIQQKEDKF